MKIYLLILFVASLLVISACDNSDVNSGIDEKLRERVSATDDDNEEVINTNTVSSNTESEQTTQNAVGKLILRLTDKKPELNITKLMVVISEVKVHRADDNTSESSWITLCDEEQEFDLMKLQNVDTLLCEKELSVGKYTQIRLMIKDAFLDIDNEAQTIKIPSSTIKLVREFSINSGGETKLTLDFDAQESVHEAGDKYILQPTIKVYAYGQAINDSCLNNCNFTGKKCIDNKVYECIENNDCFELSLYQDCGNNTCSNGTCIQSCTNECNFTGSQCINNKVYNCYPSNNCWKLQLLNDCGNFTCQNGGCIKNCTDECNLGSKSCVNNKAYDCVLGSDGCYDLSLIRDCLGLTCDAGTCTGVNMTCNNGCSLGGFSTGECISWSSSQSPEDKCLSLNATFISGAYSDCLALSNSTQGTTGGSYICCCT